jgi:hypothetical protein
VAKHFALAPTTIDVSAPVASAPTTNAFDVVASTTAELEPSAMLSVPVFVVEPADNPNEVLLLPVFYTKTGIINTGC